MIRIESATGGYEYEVHSLAKAFFPAEEIVVEDTGRAGEEPACLIFYPEGGESFRLYPDTESRDALKRSVYRALSERTGRELPWGALTGIRPVRLARKRLDAGMSDEEALWDMQQSYFVSEKKGRLAIGIAHREKEILSGLSARNGYSLYLDIPFCPSTCLYCSFTSNPVGRDRGRVEAYLNALMKELRLTAELMRGRVADTVYIGGGTPTTLLPEELEKLLGCLKEQFDLPGVKEFTVEAGRPDSITGEKLRILKDFGVSRISINPQTMKDETLRLIGRRHTAEEFLDAFRMAREEGFDHINTDMIIGLPGETAEDVRETVRELQRLAPESLTVHSLAVKRASRLAEQIALNGYSLTEDTEEMMEIASEGAAGMGLEPYYLYRQKNMTGNLENTGFAKPGKYGIYNILINEEVQDIVALGAGAVSKSVNEKGDCKRAANFKEVDRYIADVDEMVERKRRLFNPEP